MQINRVGYGLVAFFGIVGLACALVGALLPIPIEARATLVGLGGIWALTAGGLLLFSRSQRKKGEHKDWVFANGIRGTATVVKAGSSATVNDMPLMKLTLDLQIPGVGSRQATRREVMPVFAARRMAPGLVLAAHFNPADPNDFILVW